MRKYNRYLAGHDTNGHQEWRWWIVQKSKGCNDCEIWSDSVCRRFLQRFEQMGWLGLNSYKN